MTGFDDRARVMIATLAAVRMIARIANVFGVFATSFAHQRWRNRVQRVRNLEKNGARRGNLELGNLIEVCIEIGKLVHTHVG